MQAALQDARAPKWAKNFWATEEGRLNAPGRKGKNRLRIDIEVMQHTRGARPSLQFEAKRLGPRSSHLRYLGKKGLACFLDGRYAAGSEVAGMLGYVQAGTIEDHANTLERALEKHSDKYLVRGGGKWVAFVIIAGLATYRTIHQRSGSLAPIMVFHSLLACC
jgi:hypothetical protein